MLTWWINAPYSYTITFKHYHISLKLPSNITTLPSNSFKLLSLYLTFSWCIEVVTAAITAQLSLSTLWFNSIDAAFKCWQTLAPTSWPWKPFLLNKKYRSAGRSTTTADAQCWSTLIEIEVRKFNTTSCARVPWIQKFMKTMECRRGERSRQSLIHHHTR